MYERMVEKYDGYLAKPDRTKEPVVREESYLAETLDYMARIRQFRVNFELGLLSKVNVGLSGFGEFCWALGQLFRSLEPDLDQLRVLVPQWQEEEMERLAGLKHAPRRPNGLVLLEQIKSGKKSGYVYKRSLRGLSSKGNWKRTYARLEGAHFTLTAPGRLRGTVQLVSRINVLLCEVRTVEVPDRRGSCWEIYTSQKSWVLCCAEGEDEMREWLRAFEAAKTVAMQTANQANPEADPQGGVAGEDMDEDEDEFGEQPNVSSDLQSKSADYKLSRENDELHSLVDLLDTDLVLSSFCGLLKLSCDQYLSGRYMVTATGIYLIPAVLIKPPQGLCVVTIPFESIKTLEPNAQDDHMLASCAVTFHSDASLHPSLGNVNAALLMSIDSSSIDLLCRLHRNSVLPRSKGTLDLLAELGLQHQSSANAIGSSSSVAKDSIATPGQDEEVPCGCQDHLELLDLNIIFPVSVDTLFSVMFGQLSPASMKSLFSTLKYTDIEIGAWHSETATSEDALPRMERQVNYTVPLSNPLLKAKGTPCYEHNVQTVAEPGSRYIVDTEARTPQVPYGDAFIAVSRCCLTAVGPERSRLKMSAGMQWSRSPLVKSIIKDATMKGFSRYCKALLAAIKDEIQQLKPEAQVIVEETVTGGENEADRNRPNMVRALFGEIRRISLKLAKRYPIFSLVVVLCGLLYLSWTMTHRFYTIMTTHQQYVLVEFADLGPTLPNRNTWHSPAYERAFVELSEQDNQLNALGRDLVGLARNLGELRKLLGHARYATWIADRLGACMENDGECAELEGLWKSTIEQPRLDTTQDPKLN